MKDVIIIPTYNERENVETIIPLIFEHAPSVFVLVADDNSPDGTADVITKLQKNHPNLSLLSQSGKFGLGKAYINAFNHVLKDSNVRTIVMMDADYSHEPKYLVPLLENRKNFDVVIASRYTKGGGIYGWERWRQLLSRWANFYCRTITRMPIRDSTSGFNAISADLLRKVDFSKMDMSGYAFIMELKYLLYKVGGTFYEMPFVCANRREGESKISSHIISEGVFAPWKMILKK